MMSGSAMATALRSARPLQAARDPTAFFRNCRGISSQCAPQPTTRRLEKRDVPTTQFLARRFSTTTPRPATVVLKNPKVDEDGNNMSIEISERATMRLKRITTSAPTRNTLAPSPSESQSHLRVTVTSGGCHGFQYLMSLEGASKIDEQEDTIFAADDMSGEGKAVVVMDEPSLELLKGSTIDFTTELIGSQFKIVGNPRAKSSCGCGTSFDID